MSGGTYELCRELGAVLLTGVVVKIMDDHLDTASLPPEPGCPAPPLEHAVLPYCLLLFGLAGWLSLATSLSLFLASYCLGMAYDMLEKTPLGIRGYQESLVAVGAGALLLGWREMLGALCAIWAVQCFDDFLDYRRDLATTWRSLAVRLGRVEALVIGLASATVGYLVDQRKTGFVLAAAVLIWAGAEWNRRRRKRHGA